MFTSTDIYKYEVDGAEIYADPLTIRRHLLMATSGRCWEWAKQAKQYATQLEAIGSTEGEAADASRADWSLRLASLDGKLADAAYTAFSLTPIDQATGFGKSETAALEILYGFLGWLEKKGERPNG